MEFCVFCFCVMIYNSDVIDVFVKVLDVGVDLFYCQNLV